MTQLQQNRYDQLLRRVGDLKGPNSKVSDVLSELFPMFDVENLPGELYRLGGILLCTGGGLITGAAGEAGRMQLFNPVDSGKIITITSFNLTTASTSVIRWGTTAVALTTGLGTETIRDTRGSLTERPTGQIRTESSVALADATAQVNLLSNTPLLIKDPNGISILGPGTGLEMGPETNAITLRISIYWRERVAEPSELTF